MLLQYDDAFLFDSLIDIKNISSCCLLGIIVDQFQHYGTEKKCPNRRNFTDSYKSNKNDQC